MVKGNGLLVVVKGNGLFEVVMGNGLFVVVMGNGLFIVVMGNGFRRLPVPPPPGYAHGWITSICLGDNIKIIFLH